MNELLICAASLSIGLILGMIGAGGSILTVPVFVYLFKMDPLSSSVYSMFVVGVAGFTGGIQSVFNKMVDFKAILVFGIPSLIGVWIARYRVLPFIPEIIFRMGDFVCTKKFLFMFSFAVLMFISAYRMLSKSSAGSEPSTTNQKPSTIYLLMQGLFVGLITGLLGMGGGFLIVPALYFWGKLSMRTAIGTALIIIAINSLFSFANSYSGIQLDWNLLLKFTSGAVLGILAGTIAAHRVRVDQLKKIFGYFVLSLSVFILFHQVFF